MGTDIKNLLSKVNADFIGLQETMKKDILRSFSEK
jgi:hypothetical protein